MGRWAARLFGPPVLSAAHGNPVSTSPSLLTLIAYLATARDGRACRTSIIAALWPDREEAKARHCLATMLWRLKGQVGTRSQPILADGDALYLDAQTWVDTLAFETRLRKVRASGNVDLHNLAAAIRYCRGAFLDGQFAEWVLLERERLRCLHIDALVQLATLLGERERWQDAIHPAHLACALEPLRESAQRLLMMAYARTGNRGLALRQYRHCVQVLADELGVSPMASTVALAQEIAGRGARWDILHPPPAVTAASPLKSALLESRAGIISALASFDHALDLL